uniref:HMG box domain-containing protein n=1 Tax=Meloidogyne javanica TaxID=6303 RepID=A0A915LP89_MELJA
MDTSVNIPSTTTTPAVSIKTSPVPNEEIADEVKVFRSNPDVNDDDPTEIAGSSADLAEDKNELAFEADIESQANYNTQHQVNPIYNNPPHLDWPNAWHLTLAHLLSPVYAANQRIAAMAQAAAQAAYVANVASAAQYIARHSPNFANLGPQFGAASFERPPNFSMGGQTPNNNANRNGYSIQQHMASPMSSLGGVLGGISLSADRGEVNNSTSRKHIPKREKHEHKIKEKNYHNSGKSSTTNSDGKHEHIKKPMNAFMFMKENRHKYMDECADKRKQSAELNKELGQVWQRMTRDEQQPYYDMAQIKREEHQRLYPNWTARENYAIHKKAKKRRTRERSLENNDSKKCRARFGVDNQIKWCKHCKRKKKCLNVLRDSDSPAQVSSTTNPTTPLSLGSISHLHHQQQQQGGGQGSSSNNNLNGHQSTNSQFSNLFGLNLPQQHPPIKQQQLDSPLSSQKGQSTNSELSRCSSTASSDGGDESIEEEEESDMDEDNKADIKQNLMEGLESPIMSKQHDGRGAGVNVKTLKMETTTTPTSDSKLLFSPHTPPSHLLDTPSKHSSSLFGSSNNDVNNLLVAAAAASTLLPQHSSPFSSPSNNPILQQQNIPSAFQMPPPTTPTGGAGGFPFQPSPFFPWSGLNFMSSFMKH